MLIAQITDLHIAPPGELAYGGIDTAGFLRRAVAHLAALDPQPDLVVATGDLIDGGTFAEYLHLAALLRPLGMPVYLLPGNHDERDAMRAAFPEAAYLRQHPRFLQYEVDAPPLRLVALDTLLPGESGGELCAERLAWLEERLAARPAVPTLLLMHHPPFRTGIARMDELGLRRGAEALETIVARHPQVERILCGHIHRPIQRRWAGTLVSVAPGPAHQIALDLRPGRPVAIVMEPPALHLHAWIDGGLVTHQSYIAAA